MIDQPPLTGRWGRLDSTPPLLMKMTGRGQATLHVYPPGTTASMWRLLALRASMRAPDGAGLHLSILAAAGFSAGTGWVGLSVYATALTAGLLVLHTTTSRARRDTRTAHVAVQGLTRSSDGYQTQELRGDPRAFEDAADAIVQLDALRESNPIAYELEWGRIYHAIPTKPTTPRDLDDYES